MMRYLIIVAAAVLFALTATAEFRNVVVDADGMVDIHMNSNMTRLNHVWKAIDVTPAGFDVVETQELENLADYPVSIRPGFVYYYDSSVEEKAVKFTTLVDDVIVETKTLAQYGEIWKILVCKMDIAAHEKKYLKAKYHINNAEAGGYPIRTLFVDSTSRGWQNDYFQEGSEGAFTRTGPPPVAPEREAVVTFNIPGRTMVDTRDMEMKHVENRLYFKWDDYQQNNVDDIFFTYQPVIAGELRTTLINASEEKRNNANGYTTAQVDNLDIIENPGKTLPSYAPESLLRDDVVYTKVEDLADNMLALNPKGKVALKIDKGMTGAVLTAGDNIFTFTTGSKTLNKDGIEVILAGAPFLLDDPFNVGEKVLYVPLSPVVDFYKGKLTLTKELAKVSYSLPEWEPKEDVKQTMNEEIH